MSFSLAQSCQFVSITCKQSDDLQSYVQSKLCHILNTLRQEMKQLQQKYQNQIQNLKNELQDKDRHLTLLKLQVKQLKEEKKQRNCIQKHIQTIQTTSQTKSSSFHQTEQNLLKKKVFLNSQNIKIQKNNKQEKGPSNLSHLNLVKQSENSVLLLQQNIKLQRLSQIYQDFIKINSLSDKQILRQAKTRANYMDIDSREEINSKQSIKDIQFQSNNKIKLVQSYLVQDSDKKSINKDSLDVCKSTENCLNFSNKKYKKNFQEVKSETSIFRKSNNKKYSKNDNSEQLLKPIIDIDIKKTKVQPKVKKDKIYYECDGIQSSLIHTQQSISKSNFNNLSFKKQNKIYVESPKKTKSQQKSTIIRSQSSKKLSNTKCLFEQLKSDESISDLMRFHRNYSSKTLLKSSRNKSKKAKIDRNQKKNQISHFKSHEDHIIEAENAQKKQRANPNQRLSVPVSNKKLKISIVPIREISVKRYQ